MELISCPRNVGKNITTTSCAVTRKSAVRFISNSKKLKVKQSRYRPGVAPEGSRKLSLSVFVTTAQDGGRLSALRTGRLYPQEILLVLISIGGRVDPRDIVRSEGFYVNEKSTDTSWDRTIDRSICSTAP